MLSICAWRPCQLWFGQDTGQGCMHTLSSSMADTSIDASKLSLMFCKTSDRLLISCCFSSIHGIPRRAKLAFVT